MSTRSRTTVLVAFAALLLAALPAAAQREDEYEDDGIRQTVARLSWFEGDVSFNRGDDPDDWQAAAVNYPLTLGDTIWVGSGGRAEMQLRGATLFLGPESELGVLDLTLDGRQLSLTWGTATIRVRALDRDDDFEVATPNASVTFGSPGLYRIDVDEEGNTRIAVSQGLAWAAAGGGQVRLERGERMRVFGLEQPEYDIVGIGRADSWDRWVERRSRRFRSVRSASYVHPDVYGLDDLDTWGSWDSTSEWGWIWYPRTTAADWAPYRAGRWIWRDPWGWTWLSDEPWGWAPYHHGRWVLVRNRWAWVPVGRVGRFPGWLPAVVGFVGGGPGWGVTVSTGGFVGWFPLGPREPFHPWWYRSRRAAAAPPHRYAYRDRGVFVPRDVFGHGRWENRDVVRDARVLRDLTAAPVLHGPIPVVPTRDAIRNPRRAAGGRDVAAPPRRAAVRTVVTRREVPSAPVPFERKVDVIRERGGEPIRADEPRRVSSREPGGDRPVAPVRPATRGEVVLTPRGSVAPSRRPQPIPTGQAGPAPTYDRPTRAPAVDQPAVDRPTPEPTRPPYRAPEDVRPFPEPRAVQTPVPRRVDVPAPRPTDAAAPGWRDVPTPRPTRAAEPPPTPARPARRTVAPTPEPRFEAAPTPAPRIETAPPRVPRVDTPPPTRAPRVEVTPERRVEPVESRRRPEVAMPGTSAVPREAPRSLPAEKADEPKPAVGEEKAPAAAPRKAPPRRVTPGPG